MPRKKQVGKKPKRGARSGPGGRAPTKTRKLRRSRRKILRASISSSTSLEFSEDTSSSNATDKQKTSRKTTQNKGLSQNTRGRRGRQRTASGRLSRKAEKGYTKPPESTSSSGSSSPKGTARAFRRERRKSSRGTQTDDDSKSNIAEYMASKTSKTAVRNVPSWLACKAKLQVRRSPRFVYPIDDMPSTSRQSALIRAGLIPPEFTLKRNISGIVRMRTPKSKENIPAIKKESMDSSDES